MSNRARRDSRGDRLRRAWWASRWVINLALFALVVIFIAENREPVIIRLLIPIVQMPQWVALTIAVVIGGLIGYLAGVAAEQAGSAVSVRASSFPCVSVSVAGILLGGLGTSLLGRTPRTSAAELVASSQCSRSE